MPARSDLREESAGAGQAFRICAWLTAGLLWLQFLLTSRFAAVDGSLHGARRPLYIVVLLLATAALVMPAGRRQAEKLGRRWPYLVLAGGGLMLASACLVWLPPSSWDDIPYLDNWTTRFLATRDAVALFTEGAAVGWNWDFLGGYHSASDITQNLAAVAALPMLLFGDTVGYHLIHAILFLVIPATVFVDLSLDGDRRLAAIGAGLSAVGAASVSMKLMGSGDTNSLAGLAATTVALMAAHAASRGRRWGGPLLIVAMALVAWSHAGFLIYAGLFLLVDAALARDPARLARAIVAGACAIVAALPLTWELWVYSDRFIANNVILDPDHPTNWSAVIRKLFYNVELLWLPGRWFNDFVGLTYVLLPLLVFAAWRGRGRPRFHAVVAVTAFALTRLQTADTAYVFVRPMYLLAVAAPAALAGIVQVSFSREWRRWALTALAIVFLQVWWQSVPHQRDASLIEPELVEHMRGLDGALVLFENTPHRDMDTDPDRDIQAAPVSAHLESILPRLTGQRLYAGMWDGWQWCPQRDEVLAGGAFRGTAIGATPPGAVHAELSRWGVRHLIVWSDASVEFFDRDPSFAKRWTNGPWVHYEYLNADPRDVMVASGQGRLTDRSALGARVVLDGVSAGDRVTVRTHYHPAWSARLGDQTIELLDDDDQLAFDAPRDGSYSVTLEYPRRTWLFLVALCSLLVGVLGTRAFRQPEARQLHATGTDRPLERQAGPRSNITLRAFRFGTAVRLAWRQALDASDGATPSLGGSHQASVDRASSGSPQPSRSSIWAKVRTTVSANRPFRYLCSA